MPTSFLRYVRVVLPAVVDLMLIWTLGSEIKDRIEENRRQKQQLAPAAAQPSPEPTNE